MPYQVTERLLLKLALSCTLGGASAITLMSCTTAQSSVARKESNLSAAGFVARPANTPKRQAMLKRLAPNTFVTSPRGNKTNYVYADPTGCKCLYVGTQQAYDQYRLSQQQAKTANQQQLAAQAYSDSDWDWGEWVRGSQTSAARSVQTSIPFSVAATTAAQKADQLFTPWRGGRTWNGSANGVRRPVHWDGILFQCSPRSLRRRRLHKTTPDVLFVLADGRGIQGDTCAITQIHLRQT